MLGVLGRIPVSVEQTDSITPRTDDMLLMSSMLLPGLSVRRLLSLHRDCFCFVACIELRLYCPKLACLYMSKP